MSKRQAIILAATRLAAAVKATVNPGEYDIYADNLEDMRPRALELAFIKLERTHTIAALPSPGEIRELGDHLCSEEYRKEHENDFSKQIGQWKRDAQAQPITEDERVELKTRVQQLNDRLTMVKAKTAADLARQREESRKVHNLLQGVEFYLELRRVKRERDARAAS